MCRSNSDGKDQRSNRQGYTEDSFGDLSEVSFSTTFGSISFPGLQLKWLFL